MPNPLRNLTFAVTLLVSGGIALMSTACGSDSGGADTMTGTGGGTFVAGNNVGGGLSGVGGGVGGGSSTGTSGVTATCTSGVTWTPRQGENELMRPGEACIACHATEPDAPTFAIAGTVFPSRHDASDCNGLSGTTNNITVVITDATGTEHRLPVNAAGNFMLETAAFATPYSARVEMGTTIAKMSAKQTVGDCNSCHSVAGANGASGRITVP